MATTAAPKFGDLLRRFRQAAGMTQEQLADYAKLSPRAISDLERGARRRPWRETVQLLADALRLGPAERAELESAARHGGNSPTGAPEPPVTGEAELASALLPNALTSFVGRDVEEAAIIDLLAQPPVRILTLTGPGGVGKTRLALQVARKLARQFPDGVALVELAALQDPGLVLATIGSTLGVPARTTTTDEGRLVAFLRSKRLLLVLDNLEHLLAAAPLLGRLAAACPNLRLLVTSRAPLRIQGEREYAVPPLPVPGATTTALDQVLQTAAVQLFIERARAVRPDFALDSSNGPAVAEICRRLDGLPLAIELVAARVRTYSSAALLARLDQPAGSLAMATGGPRDLPPRQRTLRDTIAWSDAQLEADDRTLFYRLGVFAGGMTPAAASYVCTTGQPSTGASHGRLSVDEPPLLNVEQTLDTLVEQHLVRVEPGPDDEPRYGMLATIQAYARQAIEAGGELDSLSAKHLAWFADLAQRSEPPVRGVPGGDQQAWLRRLDVEHDNIRSALRWALSHDPPTGARLAGHIWQFWRLRGFVAEGRNWVTALLAGLPDSAADGRLILGATFLARDQGEAEAALALAERSLKVFRERGDRWGMGMALLCTGLLRYNRGETAPGSVLLDEALEHFRVVKDRWGMGSCLNGLAIIAIDRESLGEAKAAWEEALTHHRAISDDRGVIAILSGLARLALETGDNRAAQAAYVDMEAVIRRSGIQLTSSREVGVLLARSAGDYRQAVELNQGCLKILTLAGLRQFVPERLALAGVLAIDQGAYSRGVTLLSAAATLSQILPRPANRIERAAAAASLAQARIGLAPADFERAWAEGAVLTEAEAVSLALASLPPAASP
jgi:predicted ATPase/DNA-binding XRE family transcriptional regulator